MKKCYKQPSTTCRVWAEALYGCCQANIVCATLKVFAVCGRKFCGRGGGIDKSFLDVRHAISLGERVDFQLGEIDGFHSSESFFLFFMVVKAEAINPVGMATIPIPMITTIPAKVFPPAVIG